MTYTQGEIDGLIATLEKEHQPEPLYPPEGSAYIGGLSAEHLMRILAIIIGQHGGAWSRRRLEGIVLDGFPRVSRKTFIQLTTELRRRNVLRPQSRGMGHRGSRLQPDIQTHRDILRYLPDLPKQEE